MDGCTFCGFSDAWLNLAGRSTITGLVVSKTKIPMLEAYKKSQRLGEFEAQLPKDAAELKQTLKNILEGEPTDGLALLILAQSITGKTMQSFLRP